MQRIQFYPDEKLASLLSEEAQKKGVSVSALVTDLLEEHYGLKQSSLSIISLTNTVLDEVEAYIQANSAQPFDLLTASATYRDIPMVNGKQPNALRASIGRSFASKIGKPPFANVQKYRKNGKLILSENNALMYTIVDDCEEE